MSVIKGRTPQQFSSDAATSHYNVKRATNGLQFQIDGLRQAIENMEPGNDPGVDPGNGTGTGEITSEFVEMFSNEYYMIEQNAGLSLDMWYVRWGKVYSFWGTLYTFGQFNVDHTGQIFKYIHPVFEKYQGNAFSFISFLAGEHTMGIENMVVTTVGNDPSIQDDKGISFDFVNGLNTDQSFDFQFVMILLD